MIINDFIKQLATESNAKETENGQYALKSTNNALIDLFGTIGALRYRDEDEIISLFTKAYAEDRLLALKMLFYSRDILEGLGERRTFRTIINWLADEEPDDIKKNIALIPKFGRWDDMYSLVGTKLEKDAFAFMKAQFEEDIKNIDSENISLLGKWLKSVKTSSAESSALGKLTAKYFGLSEKEYRQKVSMLRKKIDVVEKKMTSNKWDEIEYSAVPSKAANIYKDAFERHDEERYRKFIERVEAGEEKINSKTLFPYDLAGYYINTGNTLDKTIEEQWKALPNYMTRNRDFLVMADVSGSMFGRPMETSVGLAIYFSERNKGLYHGKFMTFSSNPQFVVLPDDVSLSKKVKITMSSDWGYNTNLDAAFRMVLESAKKSKAKQEDIPEALVVITDMEIDQCTSGAATITEKYKELFNEAGYEVPVIVWWNVNARQNTFHGGFDDSSVRFISGSSATVFKSLCENLGDSPEELMLKTLNSERYSEVK